MKRFLAQARFKMALPGDVPNVAGGLIMPAGVSAPTLMRRKFSKRTKHLDVRYLDPQLYLTGLAAALCRKPCARLYSYGWFGAASVKKFESAKQNLRDWDKELEQHIETLWDRRVPTSEKDIDTVVKQAVQFQVSLGTEGIILPSPLTVDMASDYQAEAQWLDAGLKQAKGQNILSRPVYATVAVSDFALRGVEPQQNQLLTVILDQVSAREPDGVYILIEQTNEQGYYCSHPNTIGSLLSLVHEFKRAGTKDVMIGPVGVAGFLGLCAGADSWSTGWYRSERRIRLADFEAQEGRSVPAYYTHALAGEIHLESDLDTITKAGLLGKVADLTDASADLLKALRRGQKTKTVAEWEHRPTNVSASIEHFLRVAVRETEKIKAMDNQTALQHGLGWLQDAVVLAAELSKLGKFHGRTELKHQSSWLDAYQKFLLGI